MEGCSRMSTTNSGSSEGRGSSTLRPAPNWVGFGSCNRPRPTMSAMGHVRSYCHRSLVPSCGLGPCRVELASSPAGVPRYEAYADPLLSAAAIKWPSLMLNAVFARLGAAYRSHRYGSRGNVRHELSHVTISRIPEGRALDLLELARARLADVPVPCSASIRMSARFVSLPVRAERPPAASTAPSLSALLSPRMCARLHARNCRPPELPAHSRRS